MQAHPVQRACAALALMAALAAPAGAADLRAPAAAKAVDEFPVNWEVRAGAYVHDPLSPEKGAADLSFGVLTPRLFSLGDNFKWIVPRIQAGATISFTGKTSIGYVDLATDFYLTKQIFFEGTIGGAVNDGKTGNIVPPGHNPIGCAGSFHESASLGYRLTANWSVMATIEHMSNAGFCTKNRGVTNYGARIGYTF